MAANVRAATLFCNGLKQNIFRVPVFRRPPTAVATFQQSPLKRHLFTTSNRFVKTIAVHEVDDKIVIEGKYVPSPRKKYLAKLPSNPSSCEECPLCKLGLQVRHTDVLVINQFINSKGKQLSREVTGLCKDQHQRMDYLIVMAEKAGLIEREVERTVVHKGIVFYTPEEWEDPHFLKYYDETVIDEFLYNRRRRH